ncbi:MAG TPA: hypothetical protein VMZ52_06425, partial [Bryobacteraceae bacterium]|nr:hypothetical protein [Bryobacteraceae bacterium]
MLLSLYHDKPSSTQAAETFTKENVLERLKLLDARARRKGLESIDPARNPLIGLGMEVDQGGHVTKNSYGVFNLSWQAAEHPEWPETIMGELAGIRQGIRDVHKVPLRYLIWAGMGGSAEDKAAYNAIGLLKRGPRVYILDSTDPVKMQSILDDIQRRSGGGLADALKTTLVVGMALGMTSYEPVVNLEKLAALFEKHKIDSRPNFVYMTLPDSLLDQFGRKQGYRKVEMQLDNANGTSGRHSAPLTRGSLYPLGLASVDLAAWMAATNLGPEEIQQAWRLAAFLNTQATSGRNKIVLLLPKEWSGIGIWTKQNFEESLGKREDFGLKIVVEEKPKLARYRAPKEAGQDRAFLAVQIKGSPHGDAQKVAALRRAGYPMASVTLAAPELSRYMQFIHYTVFGVAYLQNMNFVTQPGVELYKEITNKLHSESEDAGGIEKTAEWQNMLSSPRRARWRNAITLYYDRLPGMAEVEGGDAAAAYAFLLKYYGERKQMEYG